LADSVQANLERLAADRDAAATVEERLAGQAEEAKRLAESL
jgi:hypothetical protein